MKASERMKMGALSSRWREQRNDMVKNLSVGYVRITSKRLYDTYLITIG